MQTLINRLLNGTQKISQVVFKRSHYVAVRKLLFFFWSAETRPQAIVSPQLPGDKKKCLGGLKGLKRQKESLSHRGGHVMQCRLHYPPVEDEKNRLLHIG